MREADPIHQQEHGRAPRDVEDPPSACPTSVDVWVDIWLIEFAVAKPSFVTRSGTSV